MKFVHHHIGNRKLFAFTESHVAENFSGTTKNWGVMIDCGVARGKSHVFGAEFLAERHPLFVYQRLDGAGVNAAASMSQAVEMKRQGYHGFAGTRGRVQDDVFPVQKFEDCFFLSGVECCSAGFRPRHK